MKSSVEIARQIALTAIGEAGREAIRTDATAKAIFDAVTQGFAIEVPADVARLVIASRNVAFGGLFDAITLGDPHGEGAKAMRELDKASEAFASRVPWENEPDPSPAGVDPYLQTR